MSDTFLDDPYLAINGVDYSDFVRSMRLTGGRESLDRTAGGDGGRISLPGLRIWRLEVTLKEDLTDNGIDEALWTLADAGTIFLLRARPTQAAVSATNPEWVTTTLAATPTSGNAIAGAMIDGAYDLVAGGIGVLKEKSFALIPGGTQTKLTRSTSALSL